MPATVQRRGPKNRHGVTVCRRRPNLAESIRARMRFTQRPQPWGLALLLGLLSPIAFSQDSAPAPTLQRTRFRNGEETLRAFAPVSEATRWSIVKLNVDGGTVALGTVVDASGLALTKASEIKKGKLTCWLADDQEVAAELIAVDEEEDVGLVRVQGQGLRPIQWASEPIAIGQWAITPGVGPTPHAVGIVSALPRRIRPQRAYIGVEFDFDTSAPKVAKLLPGLGAEKAGVKPGDVILAINSEAVTNRQQIVDILAELREGQTVKLGLLRAEERFEVEVRLMMPSVDSSRPGSLGQRRRNRLGGEVSQRSEGFERAIEHDSVLPPWLCGGPLVNLDGKAIGLNIARAGRVSTYALPSELAERILESLRSLAK
jgi:serine protease Do